MADLAVVSVVTTGCVSALAVVIPAAIAWRDRKHENRMRAEDRLAAERHRVWERRADAYQDALAIATALQSAAGDRSERDLPTYDLYEMQGRVLLWSSEPIRDAWWQLVAAIPKNLSKATAADAEALREASRALVEAVNRDLGAA